MGKILTLVIGCWLLVIGCSDKPNEQQLADHSNEVEAWYQKRINDLKSRNGWLNLAGLYWLHDGINSFGSDPANDVVFPEGKIEPKAGYLIVKGDVVAQIFNEPKAKETIVFHPDSTRSLVQNRGSLEWFVIKRENKVGIRVRDLESEAVKTFTGIERYPIDYSWNVKAKFEPAKAGEKINITNVLGQTTAQDLAGTYVFELDGKEQRLSATGEDDQLFIVFADPTNGTETYPAGKFVYTARPDSTGVGFIDFNKSYNPPCAFTDFATCSLPPRENALTVAITAGEKKYESHHGK